MRVDKALDAHAPNIVVVKVVEGVVGSGSCSTQTSMYRAREVSRRNGLARIYEMRVQAYLYQIAVGPRARVPFAQTVKPAVKMAPACGGSSNWNCPLEAM
jgi:hypothetical protein